MHRIDDGSHSRHSPRHSTPAALDQPTGKNLAVPVDAPARENEGLMRWGLLLLAGCGGSISSTEQESPCISQNGTYQVTYTNIAPEAAGACGSIPPYVLNGSNGYG